MIFESFSCKENELSFDKIWRFRALVLCRRHVCVKRGAPPLFQQRAPARVWAVSARRDWKFGSQHSGSLGRSLCDGVNHRISVVVLPCMAKGKWKERRKARGTKESKKGEKRKKRIHFESEKGGRREKDKEGTKAKNNKENIFRDYCLKEKRKRKTTHCRSEKKKEKT